MAGFSFASRPPAFARTKTAHTPAQSSTMPTQEQGLLDCRSHRRQGSQLSTNAPMAVDNSTPEIRVSR